MKKIAGKIAMILVLIILVNSFTGCSTTAKNVILYGVVPLLIITLLVIPAWTAIFGYSPMDNGERMAISDQDEKSAFMEVLCSLPEEELSTLKEKIDSLPEADIVSLAATFNSLPDAEQNYLTEKMISMSKTEIAALVHGLYSTPETEIASSVKKINSMPEEKLVSLVNVLQHIEAGYSLDNKAYLGLHFQF
jgi:hypothetical protein